MTRLTTKPFLTIDVQSNILTRPSCSQNWLHGISKLRQVALEGALMMS